MRPAQHTQLHAQISRMDNGLGHFFPPSRDMPTTTYISCVKLKPIKSPTQWRYFLLTFSCRSQKISRRRQKKPDINIGLFPCSYSPLQPPPTAIILPSKKPSYPQPLHFQTPKQATNQTPQYPYVYAACHVASHAHPQS